jgi:inorganic pyrophosphatase
MRKSHRSVRERAAATGGSRPDTNSRAGVMGDLPPRESGTGRIHVIVDTPAGSRNKYKYDENLGIFRLSRVLPGGTVFPCDFGSIPGTRAADGDALDVLVVEGEPTFPGCLLTVRLIGVLQAEQHEGKTIRNDRLLAVTETPVNAARIRDVSEMDEERLRALEHFFESYNAFQGRAFRIVKRGGARRAEQLLQRAIEEFQRGPAR